jgi:hypothetical protein
VPDIP